MKSLCDACSNPKHDKLLTAYGTELCEDCWDDYLMTDEGKVEYLIGLCNGDYSMEEFDADFLGHVVVCWNTYRERFTMTIGDICRVESFARTHGLL